MADAIIEIEGDDSGIGAEMNALLARFQNLGAQMSAAFQTANVQMAGTANRAREIGATTSQVASVGTAFHAAAAAAEHLGKAAEVVLLGARALSFIPSAFGAWVPKLKGIADETIKTAARFAVVTGAVSAFSGRLGVVGAAFLGFQAKAAGASKTMAVFGAASALALSKTVSLAHSATSAIGEVFAKLKSGGAIGVAPPGQNMLAGLGTKMNAAAMPVLGFDLGAVMRRAAALLTVASAFEMVKKSMSMAGEVQAVEASFATLFGNADAAKNRMATLASEVSSTSFDLPDYAKASLKLAEVTNGAESTGESLRMVGDIAAATKQPIEGMADSVGKLYDGLMNGGSVGGTMHNLEQLGVLTAGTREAIEAMQKQGASGSDIWAVALTDLQRFSGAMDAESLTWEGGLERVHHNVSNLYRAFGAPIVDMLTPYLGQLAGFIQDLSTKATEFGTRLAEVAATFAQAFADGSIAKMAELGLTVAFGRAANYLAGHVIGGLAGIGETLIGAFRAAGTILSSIFSDAWNGLKGGLTAAALSFTSLMMAGVAKLLAALSHVKGLGGLAAPADRAAKAAADYSGRAFTAMSDASHSSFAEALEKAKKQMAAGAQAGAAAAEEGLANFGNIFDVDGPQKALLQLWKDEGKKSQDFIAAAQNNAAKGNLPNLVAPAEGGDTGKGAEVSALRKIGGGGFFAAGGDPLLSEAKKQSGLLQTLVTQGTKKLQAGEPIGDPFLRLA